MNYLLPIFLLFTMACSSVPYKVSTQDAEKIKKITVISFLGDDLTVQRSTVAQALVGAGKFEKDFSVSTWPVDSEIENAIGKEIQASGRKYLPTKFSKAERIGLRQESEKMGNDVLSKVLVAVDKSGADYVMLVRPFSMVRRLNDYGNTHPLLLTCPPRYELPMLQVWFRMEIWQLQGKKSIAGSPIMIEARYGGEVNCKELPQITTKKLEDSFKPAFTAAVKSIAAESVSNSGLTHIRVQ